MNLTDINCIKELLGRHGFHFSKALGQNFLCAAWVPEDLAAGAELTDETGVLEIGPGIGCLTAELARQAKKVVCIELDNALRPVLAETLADFDNVEIVFGDVMKIDLPALCAEKFSGCARVVVCANLPYNITSPVMTRFVESGCFESITVMIQREVAMRICARENTADYGLFSVMMQWYTATEKLFDVPPHCFIPAPKVTSSVIRCRLRSVPPYPVIDQRRMFAIVRAVFQQRRKTLCNALQNSLGIPRDRAAAALAALGLPEQVRGEVLSLAHFAALSDALQNED